MTYLLLLWLAAAIAYTLGAQAALLALLRRRPAAPAGPRLEATILRPLPDDAPRAAENLAEPAASGHPLVLGVDTPFGAAASIARRVAEAAPAGRVRVVTCPGDPDSPNRKVGKLVRMLPEARGAVVVLTDADVSFPPGAIAALVAPFADPKVGLVTCPYRSVGGTTLAARFDVLLTNAGFLPSVALAERLEGVRFALGAAIAVRRSALEAAGGLEPLRDHLADDWALARAIRSAGWTCVLAPALLDHHVGSPSWSDLTRRHVRWARTMRLLRPGGYAGLIVTHGLIPAALLASVSLAPLGVWIATRILASAPGARRLGLSARDLALLPLVDAAAATFWGAGLAGRTVRWRDRTLRVRPGGRIVSDEGKGAASLPASPPA